MASFRLEEILPFLERLFSVDFVSKKYKYPVPIEISRQISDFVGFAPSYTLTAAGAQGYMRLLCLICARNARCGVSLDEGHIASAVNSAVDAAAGVGDVRRIDALMHLFPRVVITGAVFQAALGGHDKVLHTLWVNRSRVCWGENALRAAVHGGHLYVAQLLLTWLSIFRPDPELVSHAAAQDHRELVMWLWPIVVAGGDEVAQTDAIEVASADMAQWMIAHTLKRVEFSIDTAASRGDVRYLEWSRTQAVYASTRAMDRAAGGGHLEAVIWLHKNRSEGCTTAAIDRASCNGHVGVVKWLVLNRSEGCTRDALLYAIVNGDLRLLKWLVHRNVASLPPQAFDTACRSGHVHIAEWLTKSRHAIPTFLAMDWGVAEGNLNVIEYLFNNHHEGCSTGAFDAAAANGDMSMLVWLQTHYPGVGCTAAAMEGAAAGGHTDTMDWLVLNQQIACTPAVVDRAACAGSLSSLQWLHKNADVVGSTNALDGAIGEGKLAIVRWFRENRSEHCTSSGLDVAVARGHFEVMGHVRRERLAVCSGSAFRSAAEMGRLYEAAWVRRHFPDTCTDEDMQTLAWRFGWTKTILAAVGLS